MHVSLSLFLAECYSTAYRDLLVYPSVSEVGTAAADVFVGFSSFFPSI